MSGGLPKVRMRGVGEVVGPVEKQQASYEFHFAEFLRRGLSEDEAARLARAVVARDTTPSKE